MHKEHQYQLTTVWTGNNGTGTSDYRTYSRNHEVVMEGKANILGSSDPAFRGDKTRHNPEDLLVASLSACHMLWYLHLCADAGIIVLEYVDHATGVMEETPDGSGHFTSVTLHPNVKVADATMIEAANTLHTKAHEFCFIARSVNFPVHHEPSAAYSLASLNV
jgi:organic hydroperoxide reductase OsmC/OhrA